MDRRDIPQKPPLSYFVRITIPQPKIRIRIPKLLAKTMQKQFGYGCKNDICRDSTQHCANKEKMRKKPRKLLPRKIGSIFANAFGKMMIKSPEEKSSPNARNFMKSKPKWNSICAPCYFNGDDNTNKVDAGVGDSTCGVLGEQESSGHLTWVPSTPILTYRQKSKTARSLGKMMSREFNEEDSKLEEDSKAMEERGGDELCKKRILMGGKCKPLSSSGTLQYDENGIILTEIMP